MKKGLIASIILIAYMAILIKVMVFKDIPAIRVGELLLNFGGSEDSGPPNFWPFKTIVPYLLGDKGWIIAGINLFGNIGLLVPMGFLAPLVFQPMTWRKALALGVTSGLTIETLQTVLHVGIFDVDDIILNAFGVMIGYWTFTTLVQWLSLHKYKNIAVSLITVLAVVSIMFYAVYPKEHLFTANVGTGAGGVRFNNGEGEIPQSGDLCAGTNGTGQIVRTGNNTITIKRHDGFIQTISLTDQTMIRTSAGPVAASDLKTGDYVTLVVEDGETATTVLVCNITDSKTHS